MFCERCEGQYFVLLFDTYIGSVRSKGTAVTYELWKCLECTRYKRIEKRVVVKGIDDTDRGSIQESS